MSRKSENDEILEDKNDSIHDQQKETEEGETSCTQELSNTEATASQSGKQTSGLEEDETEDDGTKYIQILLYYVQDASLFKVYLDVEDQEDQSIFAKILKFSPEVVAPLIHWAESLCFSATSGAITKVLFKAQFGGSVMLFLLVLYFFQKVVAALWYKRSKVWEPVKAELVQAFLLAMMFSYQHLVTGAFTLVKCVEIMNEKVLYVQPLIECYTWWQVMVKIYIVLCIVPAFFVFSHAPFCVQNKQMSVQTFILACLFPLPVLSFHHILKFVTKWKNTESPVTNVEVGSERKESVAVDESCSARDLEGEGIGDFVNQTNHEDNKDESGGEISASRRTSQGESGTTQNDAVETQVIQSVPNRTESEEVVLTTLLKHYKCLDIFGIPLTWLGVHKFYRVILVACNTYISRPISSTVSDDSSAHCHVHVKCVSQTIQRQQSEWDCNLVLHCQLGHRLLELWKDVPGEVWL